MLIAQLIRPAAPSQVATRGLSEQRRQRRSIRMIYGALVALAIAASGCTHQSFEQRYYLGVYDPQEELSAQLYRVTVVGTTAWYSNVKYASGWAPAAAIDSLTGGVNQKGGELSVTEAEGPILPLGRSQMLYGPEAFRPVPTDHRLVLVMSADPSEFFKQVDLIAGAKEEREGTDLQATLQFLLQEETAISELLLLIGSKGETE